MKDDEITSHDLYLLKFLLNKRKKISGNDPTLLTTQDYYDIIFLDKLINEVIEEMYIPWKQENE
jgi:hypothetical protein